jgi:hypothetical protein
MASWQQPQIQKGLKLDPSPKSKIKSESKSNISWVQYRHLEASLKKMKIAV